MIVLDNRELDDVIGVEPLRPTERVCRDCNLAHHRGLAECPACELWPAR